MPRTKRFASTCRSTPVQASGDIDALSDDATQTAPVPENLDVGGSYSHDESGPGTDIDLRDESGPSTRPNPRRSHRESNKYWAVEVKGTNSIKL